MPPPSNVDDRRTGGIEAKGIALPTGFAVRTWTPPGFEQFYRAHHGRLATVLAATTGDLHVARDEDPLSRPIGWWLKEADTRIDGAFEAAFAGTGADRRRWQLLSSLAAGPASRQDIAAALDGFDDSAAIQVVVDELVERGWVEQEHHRLRLTPAGAQRHAELATRVDGVRRRVAGALPQEEYAALVRLLARLVRGLD
jgi:DNA-binding MarR family transcriptional regulator